MPSHGVDIIDGIPVILKNGIMYAFDSATKPGTPQIQLGTYNAATKVATWLASDTVTKWANEYQKNLIARSRK